MTETARCEQLRLSEVEMRTAASSPVDESEREVASRAGAAAMGFTGPNRAVLAQLGRRPRRPGQYRPRRRLHVDGARGLRRRGRRPGPVLIVRAIAEGRSAAAAVDAVPRPAPPRSRGDLTDGAPDDGLSRRAARLPACVEPRSSALSDRRPRLRRRSVSSSTPAWTSPGSTSATAATPTTRPCYEMVRQAVRRVAATRWRPRRPAGTEDPARHVRHWSGPAGRRETFTHHDPTTSRATVRSARRPTQGLPGDVRPGDRILIDDGQVAPDRSRGLGHRRTPRRSTSAGTLSNNKGINLPGVAVSVPALSDKDAEDLRWALHLRADLIALSFVRSAARRRPRARGHGRGAASGSR